MKFGGFSGSPDNPDVGLEDRDDNVAVELDVPDDLRHPFLELLKNKNKLVKKIGPAPCCWSLLYVTFYVISLRRYATGNVIFRVISFFVISLRRDATSYVIFSVFISFLTSFFTSFRYVDTLLATTFSGFSFRSLRHFLRHFATSIRY